MRPGNHLAARFLFLAEDIMGQIFTMQNGGVTHRAEKGFRMIDGCRGGQLRRPLICSEYSESQDGVPI